MFSLEPLYKGHTSYLVSAILLLIRHGDLIFSYKKNPVAVFLDGIETGMTKPIVAIIDENVIGIVVFYDFQYLNEDEFICCMYGAAARGVSKYLELAFDKIFDSLKSQGCLAVRFETKKFNLPMRFMARRLGFRLVGEFSCGNVKNGKVFGNMVYEKVLSTKTDC